MVEIAEYISKTKYPKSNVLPISIHFPSAVEMDPPMSKEDFLREMLHDAMGPGVQKREAAMREVWNLIEDDYDTMVIYNYVKETKETANWTEAEKIVLWLYDGMNLVNVLNRVAPNGAIEELILLESLVLTADGKRYKIHEGPTVAAFSTLYRHTFGETFEETAKAHEEVDFV